jgi:hypothetical protein
MSPSWWPPRGRAGASRRGRGGERKRGGFLLFDGFLEVAAANRPEEVFHALVRQVGGNPLAECACIRRS